MAKQSSTAITILVVIGIVVAIGLAIHFFGSDLMTFTKGMHRRG